MKIALAQLNYIIGDFEGNKQKILNAMVHARQQDADLVVFAELAISGYPPRDFLEFDDFVQKCNDTVYEIAGNTGDMGVLVGLPTINHMDKGKNLRNSAAFLHQGKVKAFYHKTLLPNYDVFDEYRYFEPNRDFDVLEFKGKKIAVTICEDIWNIDEHYQYLTSPLDELSSHKPDFVVNIAASPYNYNQPRIRKNVLRSNVRRYGYPIVYVNHVGAQTELLFDGNSQVMNNQGESMLELKYFEEDFGVVDIEDTGARQDYPLPGKMESMEKALVTGVQNYFRKLGLKKAILGLSGGIDSAVTAAIAVSALGAENVYAVLLPSQFSSDHSVSDAEQLAQNLNMPYDSIAIRTIFEQFKQSLTPHFKNLPFDITEENIQARTRGVLLMALSNKFGHILLNTSNKSEAAVGYGTLYGDMNGGLSVLGDVYKSEVFELARYMNREQEIIPENIITKPPSAELRPDQKDSDSLPDYEQLDAVLFKYIEQRKGPREIIQQGFDRDLVERTLRMVNTTEYKRHQTPPILRVSPKAFGMGRRMPIVAKYLA